MTKPVTWTDLPSDTRTDAITWHRDPRDVSGESKLDLIAAISSDAYDRAHAALDAILGPLLVPYEIGMRAQHAEDAATCDRLARAIVEWGEAVKRFHFPMLCGYCGAGVSFSKACDCIERSFRKLDKHVKIQPALPTAAESDVVEMTEAEFRVAYRVGWPRASDVERAIELVRSGEVNDDMWAHLRRPLVGDRRVRIVERQEAGRGEESGPRRYIIKNANRYDVTELTPSHLWCGSDDQACCVSMADAKAAVEWLNNRYPEERGTFKIVSFPLSSSDKGRRG